MSLEKIFAKANKEKVSLHQEGSVFYIVLGKDNNLIDFEFIRKYHECLDTVEKHPDPCCLVTIGTGPRIFSSGFDLKMWKNSQIDQIDSII